MMNAALKQNASPWTLDHFDARRNFWITGFTGWPRFLSVTGCTFMLDVSNAALFRSMLADSAHRAKIESNMQRLENAGNGQPLLTTWLSWEAFAEMLDASLKNGLSEKFARLLQGLTDGWHVAGVGEVFIDGFLLMNARQY